MPPLSLATCRGCNARQRSLARERGVSAASHSGRSTSSNRGGIVPSVWRVGTVPRNSSSAWAWPFDFGNPATGDVRSGRGPYARLPRRVGRVCRQTKPAEPRLAGRHPGTTPRRRPPAGSPLRPQPARTAGHGIRVPARRWRGLPLSLDDRGLGIVCPARAGVRGRGQGVGAISEADVHFAGLSFLRADSPAHLWPVARDHCIAIRIAASTNAHPSRQG